MSREVHSLEFSKVVVDHWKRQDRFFFPLTPSLPVMDGRACKQYVFWSYNASTFNAMCFGEGPFTGQCEREKKKVEGFKISHF